jgi:hypothetical protein
MENWLFVSLAGLACVILTVVVAASLSVFTGYLRYRSSTGGDASAGLNLQELAGQIGLRAGSKGVYEGQVALARGTAARLLRAELRGPSRSRKPQKLALGTPVRTGDLTLEPRVLRTDTAAAFPHRSPTSRGERIGDADFDVRFEVLGDIRAHAALPAPVRVALIAAAEDALVRVEDGWLWLEFPATGEEFRHARERLPRLEAAAAAFERLPADLSERIRHLAKDALPKVRLSALDRIVASGDLDFSGWLAHTVADDPDPELRVRAAEVLADPRRMVQLASDHELAPPLRARVARAVGPRLPPTDRLELARALTRKVSGPGGAQVAPDPVLVDVALELSASLGPDAELLLHELLHGAPDPVAHRIISLIGPTGSVRTAEVLEGLARGDRAEVVRAAAKRALGSLQRRMNQARTRWGEQPGDNETTRSVPLNAVQPGTARALSSKPPRRTAARKPPP